MATLCRRHITHTASATHLECDRDDAEPREIHGDYLSSAVRCSLRWGGDSLHDATELYWHIRQIHAFALFPPVTEFDLRWRAQKNYHPALLMYFGGDNFNYHANIPVTP